MQTVVLTIHLIIIFALCAIILIQRNEGGGLGIGGGGNQGLGGRSAANPLTRITWALAAGFIATSIILTLLAGQESREGGVLDNLGTEILNDGTTEDTLLPPSLSDEDALLPPSNSDESNAN